MIAWMIKKIGGKKLQNNLSCVWGCNLVKEEEEEVVNSYNIAPCDRIGFKIET